MDNNQIEKQAEISRAMTGSKLSTSEIVKGVMSIPITKKEIICKEVYPIIKKYDLPFDKAFPLAKKEFNQAASNYNMDAAIIFWIYIEWLKEHDIK